MAPLFSSVIKKENGESGQQLHREGPGRLRGPWHPAGRGHSHTSSRGSRSSFLEHGARGCSGHSRLSRGCRESAWGPKVNNCSFHVFFLRAQETGVCPVPLAVAVRCLAGAAQRRLGTARRFSFWSLRLRGLCLTSGVQVMPSDP